MELGGKFSSVAGIRDFNIGRYKGERFGPAALISTLFQKNIKSEQNVYGSIDPEYQLN